MANILINAGPGSGKTWSLTNGYLELTKQTVARLRPTDEQKDIFDYLKERFSANSKCVFVTHANSVKDKLQKELPSTVKIYTFHGLGFLQVKNKHGFKQRTNSTTEEIIKTITGRPLFSLPDKWQWFAVKKLVHLLKMEDLKPTEETLEYLTYKYPELAAVSLPENWVDRVNQIFSYSMNPEKFIDYDDMVWLGSKCIGSPQYDIAFVDESQDTSKGMYNLVSRLAKNVVFCGDRNQAINAFAGASEEIYDNIADTAEAILPLKMTLRCPPHIVDMANRIRPGGIIKGPNMDEGDIETLSYTELAAKLKTHQPNDCLIVSRTNAVVIGCAMRLHKEGIPVKIIDADLGKTVIAFARSLSKNINDLHTKLIQYEEKAKRNPNPLWAQIAIDKCQQVKELLDGVRSFNELEEIVKETFKQDKKGYPLCSVHKSKGLEAKNIYVIKPPIELGLAMTHKIYKEQELNLAFVGCSRSFKNHYWVK